MPQALAGLFGLLALVGLSACQDDAVPAGAPVVARIQDLRLNEISGLAESRRSPGVFWVHNDSGHAPRLWAVDRAGQVQAEVLLEGVANVDWEDLAAFTVDGVPMLAVADCGDNFERRASIQILLLPEPDLDAAPQRIRPQVRVLSYPEGPRDYEAMFVDGQSQQIYLIDKGRPEASVYGAALSGGALRPVATLAHRHPGPRPRVMPISGRYRGAVTAADLSQNGRRLLVLTYTHWLVYERPPEASWAQALQRRPVSGRLPLIRGFEAAAWDSQDGLWATVEARSPALFHWPLAQWRPASSDVPAAVPSAAFVRESTGSVP